MKEKQELTDYQIKQLILLTMKIQKMAKEKGIGMTKSQAKRHAIDHLGFVDRKFRDEVNSENAFKDYLKTADPKYRKAT